MKAKGFKSLRLKRFSIDTETFIISPNPETTALYGEMHPSTLIVIL